MKEIVTYESIKLVLLGKKNAKYDLNILTQIVGGIVPIFYSLNAGIYHIAVNEMRNWVVR